MRELMEMLKAGGPYAMAAIFILGWWLERRDRLDQESHMRAVYEKTVTLVQETTRTVDAWRLPSPHSRTQSAR